MNSVETTTGANDGKMKPIKTFPEAYEIKVRTIISKYVESGEQVDNLVLELLEFYEEKGIKG
jgi:hypothetical protein